MSQNENVVKTIYTLAQLPNSQVNGEPNTSKYFISTCQDAVNSALNTAGAKGVKGLDWFELENNMKKLIFDWDKSRVLKAALSKTGGTVILKLGDGVVREEYEMGERLKEAKLRGFMRFICHFSCNDNHLEHDGKARKTICKSQGNSMHVIMMPYLEMGSIGDFKWDAKEEVHVHQLRSLLKQTILFILAAWEANRFFHGDLHVKNVLIKRIGTNVQKHVHVRVNKIEYTVEHHGVTAVIMDFENSRFIRENSKNNGLEMERYFWDVDKLFSQMKSFMRNVSGEYDASLYIRSLQHRDCRDPFELIGVLDEIDKIKLVEILN